MGREVISKIVFICSDMWEPYLKLIREKCADAVHILDRFHIVAKMNKALDEVRAEETRRMAYSRKTKNPHAWRGSLWLLVQFIQRLHRQIRIRLPKRLA